MRKRILVFCCFLISFSVFAEEQSEQVVILGSGPAGLTAAIYSARAGLSTLLIEGEEPGGQISLSYSVDNFPGFPQGIRGDALGDNIRRQALRFGAQIRNGKAVSIDFSRRPFVLRLSDSQQIRADAVIIALGASPKWLGLLSEKELIGKGVSSCATCDGALYKDKEVVVVGGGDAALEDALLLSRTAKRVTLIHRRDFFRGTRYLQEQVTGSPHIDILWNSVVEEIKDPGKGKVSGVVVKNVKTDQTRSIPCEAVFVAIGHTPNTELFKGQMDLNEEGFLVTDPKSTATKIPGVFVAGDAADPHYRQAVTAAASVFFIDNLGFVKHTEARKITLEDSLAFEKIHAETYAKFGFECIKIPLAPLLERVGLILKSLE